MENIEKSSCVLITGANGLVGSAIARRLVEAGHQVLAMCRAESDLSLLKTIKSKIELIEGDVLDILSLEKAIAQAQYVVHAAAVVSFAPKDRNRLYKINVEGTANVVNVCLEKNIKKLVFISSVAAIGRPIIPLKNKNQNEGIFINENQKWEESPFNSHYAKSKYLAENEVWRAEAEGLNVVVLNPSIILGEGDWNKSSTQLFKYVYDENPFYTFGTINYVDVKDVVEAVFRLIFSEMKGERFILNAGSMSYQAFFNKIADAFGKKRPKWGIKPNLMEVIWRIEAVRSWLTGKTPLITKETAKTARTNFIYDNHKIKKILDFEFTPLDETIRRVVKNLA
jgi:dihydroflavonol-4-reductase